MIAALVGAEIALLGAGIVLGYPFLGAAVAAAVLFFATAISRPNVAWALVWMAFPFSIEVVFQGRIAVIVPTEPMIAMALLAWAARLAPGRSSPPAWSRLHVPLLALCAVVLVSSLLGPYPVVGLKAWLVVCGYALFGFIYPWATWSDAGRAERLYPWIVGAGAIWGLYGTGRVLAEGISLRYAYGAARPFFTEHGAYAAYLAMILPLALLLTWTRRGAARALYAAASLSMGVGIVLSFTRAAWVSLAIVIPLMAAAWSFRHRTARPVFAVAALVALSAALVVGIGAGGGVGRHVETIVEAGDVSNLERFNRWMAAADMARARPLFGFGFASFPYVYPQYRHKTLVTSLAYQHMGAHSELFRLISENGFLGLFAAVWVLAAACFLGFHVFRRSSDPRAALLSLAALAGLGTFCIHAFFRTYIDLEKIAVPFWSSLGALAGMGRRLGHPDP